MRRWSAFGQFWRRTASTSAQSAKVRKLLRRQAFEIPENAKVVISASKCEQYSLPRAMAELTGHNLRARLIPEGEAISCRVNSSDVIVLENGTVVAWDMTENDVVERLLNVISGAEINPFNDVETEDVDFVEEQTPADSDVRSGMVGDVIYINGPSDAARLRDKLAFSSGLARHTKLSAIEYRAEKIIQQVRKISSDMAAGLEPHFRQKDVMVLTGKLLQLRGALNLYSGVTETPDIYWSEPELERLYELVSMKLDVEPRVKILNDKLNYVADTLSILKSELSEKVSLRLEWMIIILITVEVIFELRHLFPWELVQAINE